MLCLAVAGCSSANSAGDQSNNVSALVQLSPLHRGSLPITVKAYGIVEPSDAARETISAPVAVRVAKVAVRPGELIRKGAPMMTLKPGPETLAAYRQAQLADRLSSQLLERSHSLVKSHLKTEAELAKDEKAAAEANSQLAALKEEGAGGPNTISAPYDAIVLKIDSGVGSVVSQGAQLMEIAQPGGLVLNVGVLPSQAVTISAGDQATITPVGAKNSIAGSVVMQGAVVSQGDGLVPVQISLPEGKFMIGESASAQIETGQAHGYLVSHSAVLVDDHGQTYVVQSVNLTAKEVPVRVLASNGDKDVIEGSLTAGADIVVMGNHQVTDGMRLRIAEAMNVTPGKAVIK